MDTRPPEEQPKPTLLEQVKAAPVSVLLIAVNVAVFAIAEAHGSTQNSETLLRFGAAWRGLVWAGEWWRLFTPMFLHIGPVHLGWNAWFGYRLCAALERELGPVKFLALYLGSGVAGAALSVIGHDAVSAGASGALFGLIGARYLRWRLVLGSWASLWSDEAIRKDVMWTGMWFVLGAFAGFDNWAHLGGMVFGVVAMWAIVRATPLSRVLAVVALGAFISAALRPLPFIHTVDRKKFAAYDAQVAKDWERVLAETDGLALDAWVLDARLAALLELNRAAEALPLANQRVATKDASGWRLRGYTYEKLGDHALAIADYDRALALAPDDVWTLTERLREHRALFHLPEARRDAEHLIRLDDSAVNHAQLASIALDEQNREATLAELDLAIAKAPGEPHYPLLKASYLALFEETAKATELFDATTLTKDPSSELRQTFVYAAFAVGRYDRAATECSREPRDARLTLMCGWMRLLKADEAGARRDFEQSMALEPSGGALAGLALLAHRQGDAKRAKELSDESFKLDPGAGSVAMVRAEVLLAAGDEAGARESWKIALARTVATERLLVSDAVRALAQ